MRSRSAHSAKSKVMRHSSETTTSTISDGTPDRSMMVSGRPPTGMRRRRPITPPSEVARDHAREHEGEAAVVVERFDPRLEPEIGRGGIGLFEPSHRVVENLRQVADPERHRRVDRDPGIGGEVAGVFAPRQRHRLLEDRRLRLLLLGGAAAHQRLDRFLVVEQPKRQLQIVDVDGLGAVAEGRCIFIVRVEQDDMGKGVGGDDRAQDQRDGAGFARSGGAEHGEMLGQQLVRQDVGGAIAIVIERTDADADRLRLDIDRREIRLARRHQRRAGNRVLRHAAAEAARAVRIAADLAQEIGGEGAARRLARLPFEGADCADHVEPCRRHLDQAADADGAGERVEIELDGGGHRRAGDGHDVAERRVHVRTPSVAPRASPITGPVGDALRRGGPHCDAIPAIFRCFPTPLAFFFPGSGAVARGRPTEFRGNLPNKIEGKFMSKRLYLAAAAAAAVLIAPFHGASADALTNRGKYLVELGGCSDCHTPGNFLGHPDMKRFLGGSDVGFAIPGLGVFVGRNLTPDKETGLGKWTRQQIITAFTTGKRPDGRMLAPIMPWRALAHLTRRDAESIAAYLQSLPPVEHAVPGPFGPNEKVSVFVMTVLPADVYNGMPKPPPGH